MLSIHPEAKDFGNEDETNYETDEINKENMRVLHFYCWPKIRKYKTYNKIRQANLRQILSKEERVEGSKRRTFSHRKTGKWRGIGTFNFYVFSTKRSSSRQHKECNSEFTERTRLYTFKISCEVLKSWWKHYWSKKVKVIIHKPPEKWERLKRTTSSPKASMISK